MYLQQDIEGGRRNLAVGEPLAGGGEARIFALRDHPGLVAKVYHTPNGERAAKLKLMLAHPPADAPQGTAAVAAQLHASIAWPVHLLRRDHSVVGFVMPRARGMRPVFEFYNPKSRREQTPQFSWFYLHRAARNLAAAVNSLHAAGYVIGDVNESNILVSDRALITLVDTDSFQVRDPGSTRVFRCQVGKPEFTPPELQGVVFSEVTRTPEHDLFGLGVILFQMLMEGTHPFAGRYTGAGEPPPYEERIGRGHYPYSPSLALPYEPMPLAPPLGILHPPLAGLFERCFVQGHREPSARPTADQWQRALAEAEANLAVCSVNSQHRFGFHLPVCPWCERSAQLGGRDPFPRPGTRPRKPPIKKRPPAAPGFRATPPRVSTAAQPRRRPAPSSSSSGPNWPGGIGFVVWIIVIVMSRVGSCNSSNSSYPPYAGDSARRLEELRQTIREFEQKRPGEKPSGAEIVEAYFSAVPAQESRQPSDPLFAEHSYNAYGSCKRCGLTSAGVAATNQACVMPQALDRAPVLTMPNLNLEAGAPPRR